MKPTQVLAVLLFATPSLAPVAGATVVGTSTDADATDPVPATAPADDDSWTIRADRIYTAAGDPIEGGVVAVKDGKISAVSGGGSGTLECAAVTPGLIDLSVRIDTGAYSVEQADETPIALRVSDALDLYSYRWDRELRSGVTTVLANPEDKAVLGGLGVVLKTGGEPTLDARVLRQDAVLRGSLGAEPSSGNRPPRGSGPSTFYYRRPTTRMGVEWILRKSFYDALAVERTGEGATPELEILQRTLKGEVPLVIQGWATQDIRTAVYLKEEFSIPKMFIDGAAEAWHEPDLLVRSGAAVVLPPFRFQGGPGTDGSFYAYDTAARLQERGVMFALSGHGASDPVMRLNKQPGYAMRGGLDFADALAAVTINPARMVGVDDRVGSIEVGKDADLVLWSGTPFEPTSRVIGVLLNGELVLDPRESNQ
ncbi:MAG: amidohydrolase family protein [Planctomycetota bacterium]